MPELRPIPAAPQEWPFHRAYRLRQQVRSAKSLSSLLKLTLSLVEQIPTAVRQIQAAKIEASLPDPDWMRASLVRSGSHEVLSQTALALITELEAAQAAGVRVPILEAAPTTMEELLRINA